MRKIICSLLFLLPMVLHAQQTNVDSLINVLETQKLSDDQEIELYKEISRFYLINNYDSCIAYANKGLSLAEKIRDIRQIALFNKMLGISYFRKRNFDMSYIHLNKSLEFAIRLKDKDLEIGAYGNIGNMYKEKKDYQTAIDYYMKSLAVSDTISRSRAVTLCNLGSIHRELYHWDRALKYLDDALDIIKKLNLNDLEISTNHTLGNIYSDKQEFEKAIEFYKRAFNLSIKYQNKDYEMISTQSLAGTYSALKNYDKAIEYGKKALNIAEKFGVKEYLQSSQINLSGIYLDKEQYKESEEMALRAWATDSTSINEGGFAAYNLSIANIYLGNKKKAEYFVNRFQDIMLKGHDKQMNESLADMEIKYETQKKEIRIANLEKERKLYLGLGISIATAFLLGIGLLIYRHRSKQKMAKQKIKQLEQEKELISARSALDAEKAEREIIARDLHDGVGAMLNVVKNNMDIMRSYSIIENKEVSYFNNAVNGLEESIVELRRIAHHIMPAVLIEKGLFVALDDFCRSTSKAKFIYTEPEQRFDPEKELVIYRCAYELVNNALKHAKAKSIEVHLNVDDETAFLSVVDDGSGFDLQNAPQGMGIRNLNTRLAAFGGKMEIFSEPGKGTEANVEMKL